MHRILTLLLSVLLAGCISSPQKAQYNAEYANRQDIRAHEVYRFMTKPVKSSGEKYWGAGDLAELLYVVDDKAAVVELRFNYPAKSMQVTARDAQNKVLRERTFILMDEAASKPADSDIRYFYLTKEGELATTSRNCTPDMSAGCRWWNYKLFITHNADLAVQYEHGAAGLAFLVFPMYSSSQNLEIFPKATGG
ncbi:MULTISPECIES: hypothetical protein [Kosakonia]|uniref:Lipoprotein n=1 Tax=Kosakonia sacchari TaxID=1158459 RepID=A0ABZ0MUY8_9ENTR|nr:hypothetical protein [Kosakonia sacchari]WOZ79051.1 hypothetical protein Q8Y70_08365 [Kosakonia sacchari]